MPKYGQKKKITPVKEKMVVRAAVLKARPVCYHIIIVTNPSHWREEEVAVNVEDLELILRVRLQSAGGAVADVLREWHAQRVWYTCPLGWTHPVS